MRRRHLHRCADGTLRGRRVRVLRVLETHKNNGRGNASIKTGWEHSFYAQTRAKGICRLSGANGG